MRSPRSPRTQDGAPSYEAGAAVGGPIIDDKLGFRISGWARHEGGWIDKVDYADPSHVLQSDTNDVDTYVVRGVLAWKPVEGLILTPSVFYQNRDANNIDDYWVGISDPDGGDYRTGTPENMSDKDHFTLAAFKADYVVGNVEVISNTSYFSRDQVVHDYSGTLYNLSYFQSILNPTPSGPHDPFGRPCAAAEPQCKFKSELYPLLTPTGLNLPGFGHYESNNYVTNTQDNFTQEIRFQSADTEARFNWIVGVFYTNQSQLSVEEINDPQLPR